MSGIVARLRRKGMRLAGGAFIVMAFALHAAGFWSLPGVDVVERHLYDMRTRWTFPGGVDDRVVILDIDEKSLAEFGRWPWNRARMAKITQRLFDRYGVAVLGFDEVWAEAETTQWQALLTDSGVRPESAGALAGLDTDRLFAQSLRAHPAVLGAYFTNEPQAVVKNVLPKPVLTLADLPAETSRAPLWRGFTGNIAPLMDGGTVAGHTNSLRDADGVIRRVPLLIRHGNGYYESLSLAMVRQLLGNAPVRPEVVAANGYARVEALMVGPLRLPVDDELAGLVSFRGPSYSFRYIPLGDVLAGRVPEDALRGKVALIGTSAPGLGDNRATAAEEFMPGVEVHANMIAAMLDQTLRAQPAYTVGLDAAQVVVLGLVAVAVLALAPPVIGLVCYLALMALAGAINMAAWSAGLLVIPLAPVLLMLTALYVFTSAWGYFVEGRAKRQLREVFGQYVPPKVVAQMAKDPATFSLEGKDAELTVLFADLRGFTSISEQLTAPQLAAYINEYLTSMSAVITRHNGTLDKFIGDAIMAFWGAPIPDPEAARNAMQAALDMQLEAQRLNADLTARGLPRFAIGVGINSGPMRVGDMGSRLRRAYTVMGDAVNLGSRLEGLSKTYGVGIVVGEATVAMLPDYLFRHLDRVRVKGKEQAVDIYEPIGLSGATAPDVAAEVARWNEVTAAWFAGRPEEADRLLLAATATCRVPLCAEIYARRIAQALLNPLAAPDLVTVFETK